MFVGGRGPVLIDSVTGEIQALEDMAELGPQRILPAGQRHLLLETEESYFILSMG